MTRRLDIVNLSNWDGEDYDVVTTKESKHDASEKVTLKPGESLSVYPHQLAAIAVVPSQSKELEPFRDESGAQVTPQMKVEFQ